MKLGYVIMYVPEVATAVEFYERAFGLTRRFIHESGDYAEMETGGTALSFAAEALGVQNGVEFQPLRPDQRPAGIEIALVTDDVTAAVARAADAGAVVVKQPEKMPWGQTVAYVRDLNGALVELCTPMG
jgi:catechol 2,3-dioxygenase-like lactoylglutathione lyase family enzyme